MSCVRGILRGPCVGLGTLALIALAVSCGDSAPGTVFIGTGGNSGTGGTGATGTGGGGGDAGTGGMNGTGGTGGTGTGGDAGTGGTGTGGTGGDQGPCVTNGFCKTCPVDDLCNTDDDCVFSGYVCVASGCETHEGAPIKRCQPSRAPSCNGIGDCPNATDYACIPVGVGPEQCVRITAGCNPSTESYDCAPGFSCESGSCKDRRLPCQDFTDCPKNHVCTSGGFCVHVFRTCHVDTDCAGFGRFCADIDNDGRLECAGQLGTDACVNSDCTSPAAPVCEAGGSGVTATCGSFGLCLDNGDCAAGFECLALWQDGRKECVPINGTCDQVTDCQVQQVCASPRSGGPPTCQAGSSM